MFIWQLCNFWGMSRKTKAGKFTIVNPDTKKAGNKSYLLF